MRVPAVHVVDFETFPIQGRPEYPPKPVSMSIRSPGMKKAKKWLWGHPTGNNCTLKEAQRDLKAIWKPGNRICCHNSKFDVDVAETHMGVPRLPALDMHCTMIMAFLHDPHSRELGLKPLADRHLDLPPEEMDAVHAWAKANREHCLSQFFTKPFRPGAYVAYAPGEIVAPYVGGDADRTWGMFQFYWRYIVESGMLGAYQREQKVMPIFLDNERVGIRVDVRRLTKDLKAYKKFFDATDHWLRTRLKSNDLNINSDQDFAQALIKAKVVRQQDFTLTKTGLLSVSKDNLTPDMFKDKAVIRAFGYRNRLQTCINMFMQPWLDQVQRRGDGYISTNWNQVRNAERGKGGTRTGRPSTSEPNFLNISKSWGVDDGYEHPTHLSVDPLPLVRKYLLPDDGEQWLHRDFNGQELRLLAHFEDGPLMEAYRQDPWLDVHQHVADLIEEKTGKTFARKNVKIANFRIIYGGGATATAAGIGCSMQEAEDLLAAHAKALPSVKGRGGLAETCKRIGKEGNAIVTWGGRLYFCEPPGYSKKYGRMMTYEYKLLNYECQGSAADVTKQSMINYHEHPKRRGRFLVQVYDEMNSSSGPDPKKEMAVLRDSMESVSEHLGVPMLSEGKIGPTWGDQKKFEEGPSKYA